MSKREAPEAPPGYENLKHPSAKRAKEIDENSPYSELQDLLKKVKDKGKGGEVKNVVHWFRSKDLRLGDNRGFYAASQKAQEGKGALIGLYLYTPKDLEWHGTSPARTDFLLESLKIMKDELAKINIPLAIAVAEQRKDKSKVVLEFLEKHNVSHLYANFEYEIDEIRRDCKILRGLEQKDTTFTLLHDQTVVEPMAIRTGAGGPAKVFTPYHKSWLAKLQREPELLNTVDKPSGNDKSSTESLKALFETKVPTLPDDKNFASNEDRERIRKLWPAGEEAGMKRLDDFLKNKVKNYATNRSMPAKDPSSRMSAYFSAGVVSVREVLKRAKEYNNGKNFTEAGGAGIAGWVREIVFREFYRQMLIVFPHNAMNLPQNLKFDFIHWEDDEEGWTKWKEGKTGVPFVDAGMRQLNNEAYMHNRTRMIVASYLRTNLLIDYRKGERYFAEHLIDWDLANNTQGWEPSFTVFNPINQAEKHDPNGDYIRHWVPELSKLRGPAIYSPHDRLAKEAFEKLGYPAPHVNWKESKARALDRYKRDLAEADI